MNGPIMLVAVDVRRASVAGSSRANIITKLTIPPVKFATANHNPGGGVISVDFTLPRIQPLEPAFSVKGIDLDIFSGMGVKDEWTFAGAYRKDDGSVVPARAILEGAITEWTPDESSPEEFQGCTHMVKEVTHYELTIDKKEYWYIDMKERIIRRNGVDLFADVRTALGA